MNINRITYSNHNPSFGIKYIDPKSWQPEVLETLMHSNIVKEIDNKYPHATASFYRITSGGLRSVILELNNDIKIDAVGCSIYEPNAVDVMCKKIKNMKLSHIEQHFPFLVSDYTQEKIDNLVKEAEEMNKIHEKGEKFSLPGFLKKLFAFDTERNMTPDIRQDNVVSVGQFQHKESSKKTKVQ